VHSTTGVRDVGLKLKNAKLREQCKLFGTDCTRLKFK